MTHINVLVNPSSFLFNRQTLCKTILENDVDLLTITANGTKDNPISSRDYVVISARVHPGESNASEFSGKILCVSR